MMLTVALSMALTPLLLWIQAQAFEDSPCRPKCAQHYVIEHDGSRLIIAGFDA